MRKFERKRRPTTREGLWERWSLIISEKMFMDYEQGIAMAVFLRFDLSGAWFKNLAQLDKT